MYVKLLDGRYAGETRDLAPGAARDLIELGRAEKAFQDPAPEAPPIFASGGNVESIEKVLVAEHCIDDTVPNSTAAKKKKIR
jgi:hypothetical protein